jgi:hypothetical protein
MTHSEFNHLLDSITALSPEQMRQLRCELDRKLASSPASCQPPLSEEELADQEAQRRLFEAGLLSEIKPPRRVSTGTEEFTPIVITGEPISETVIRERR